MFLSLSSPHFLSTIPIFSPHNPSFSTIRWWVEEGAGGLSLYRKDYSYINWTLNVWISWTELVALSLYCLWDSFVFIVFGEVLFGGWLVAEDHTAVAVWESLAKGKCVCGHRHAVWCKETHLYGKVRCEIAQSKPQAEAELPLSSLLNKYTFLPGLKSHAARTGMLKMSTVSWIGAIRKFWAVVLGQSLQRRAAKTTVSTGYVYKTWLWEYFRYFEI